MGLCTGVCNRQVSCCLWLFSWTLEEKSHFKPVITEADYFPSTHWLPGQNFQTGYCVHCSTIKYKVCKLKLDHKRFNLQFYRSLIQRSFCISGSEHISRVWGGFFCACNLFSYLFVCSIFKLYCELQLGKYWCFFSPLTID